MFWLFWFVGIFCMTLYQIQNDVPFNLTNVFLVIGVYSGFYFAGLFSN